MRSWISVIRGKKKTEKIIKTMRQYNTCRCLPCRFCETRWHWIHADKSVSFGAYGGRATRGLRQGSARHCGGCQHSDSPWVLSNLERAKPSELQPSFCSQSGDGQGKRSDRFNNISMMLCPTCWAHVHTDALSSLNLPQCD